MIGEAWVVDLADSNEPDTIAHFEAANGAELAEAFVAGLEYVIPDEVHEGRFAIDVDRGEA